MKKLLLILIVIIITLFLIKRKDMTWRQSFLKTVYPLVMLKSKLFPNKKEIQVNNGDVKPPVSFYSLHGTANNGTNIDFNIYKGKKILIVNTASDCGYTAQYDELEKLHHQYPGLVILGFPANDFKEQEKKDDHSIAEFCKLNYGITFQLMQKSHVVHGSEQNTVFKWLSDPAQNGWCTQQPVWNFSKYVVNEDGVLMNFFAQTVSPLGEEVKKAVN
jgi:glutathione peroxidase